MNLRIFFDIVPDDLFLEIPAVGDTMNNLSIYHIDFPDWKSADIAIIGLVEDQGSPQNTSIGAAANEIRKKLYHLKQGTSHPYKIVDLGNLRCGVNLHESYLRMKEVSEELLRNSTFPIFIGGGHDMDFGQFLGYENSGKLLNILNVDALLDMQATDALGANKHHIHKILTYEPNYIFHYCHLAYQSFLCEPESVAILEKLHFEAYRIGAMHHHLEEIEPAIRNADMLSFDISAIKSSDAWANNYRQPFGLTGEEACQICWYAGLNSKLTSAGFYEYNPNEDRDGQTASVIATMIWYLIEGFYHRKHSNDFKSDEYTRFIVAMASEPHQVVFFKHNQTEKWWMEVPHPTNNIKYERNSIIPCSYNDYLIANKGELPNRWILAHSKLI
ncbi:MAG: formiminoglutamase [Cytophagales bacterium]|nr:MAG: formiminoglutamase [Cytophagales bacterium]